jgi:hypothetical protein
MEDLNAELEVLQSLTTSRTPRFTAVDELPLERHGSVELLGRFVEPQAQNQYFRGGGGSDTRSDTRGTSDDFLRAQFSALAQPSGTELGGFSLPLRPEPFSREGISLSGGRVGSRT